MRLENLLALTEATLLNEPCVNSFENIVFEARKVKRGDLFIASDIQDIQEAVQSGAYGVVFDSPTQILDNEIAWIQVASIDEALAKLLRFKLIEQEVVSYSCDEIVYKLALQIQTDENFAVVSLDDTKRFHQIWNLQKRTLLLFCPSLHDQNIFTNVKKLTNISKNSIEIVEQTLFETSFIYKNRYYERQLISPFFIPYLEELFHLYDTLNINFKLKRFTPIDNFEAVFTNKNLEIKDFGASNKVLIFEKNSSLIEKEIHFLQSKAPWANIVYLLPSELSFNNTTNIIHYKEKSEIVPLLKNTSFHFALVVGVDKSILNVHTPTQTKSLFET